MVSWWSARASQVSGYCSWKQRQSTQHTYRVVVDVCKASVCSLYWQLLITCRVWRHCMQAKRSYLSILGKRFWTEHLKATTPAYLHMARQVCYICVLVSSSFTLVFHDSDFGVGLAYLLLPWWHTQPMCIYASLCLCIVMSAMVAVSADFTASEGIAARCWTRMTVGLAEMCHEDVYLKALAVCRFWEVILNDGYSGATWHHSTALWCPVWSHPAHWLCWDQLQSGSCIHGDI